MNRFDGKVIVITGAGSGLGRECALQWAAEGASIVVTDLVAGRADAVARTVAENGGNAVAMKVDVVVEDEVAASVESAVDNFGRLDVMFANAGRGPEGFGSIALEDITEAQWDDINNVLCRGVFFCGKHACRQMKRQGGGNIVVTLSAGALNAYPGFGSYCTAKAGAAGLVRSMAFDWGRYGIRANGLCPTHGMSPNFLLPLDAEPTGLSYEELALQKSGQKWDPYTMFRGPLKVGRPPSLSDNAAVASFLASDDSAYMSGVVMPSCDGGSFARSSLPFPDNWTLHDQVDA